MAPTRLPGGSGGDHADTAGLIAWIGESPGGPGDHFRGAVMGLGLRVRIARQNGVDDGLLPFFYGGGEGFDFGEGYSLHLGSCV